MVPSKRMFKFGMAVFAAAAGVILAISSAGAHAAPRAQAAPATSSTGQPLLVSIVISARFAGSPMAVNDPASDELLAEQDQDATEAAELAAKIRAEQAEAAAQAAAEAAQDAAEAAANACKTADRTEDATERASDQSEDAAEQTNGTESDSEDSAERAARQATDNPEDAAETPCAVTEEHHSDGGTSGDDHQGTSTFSSDGDH